jgi:hypothetical protein
MTPLKLTLALALALFGTTAEAGAGTVSGVVDKSDLGISLYEIIANTEGKGDCDCQSLYDSKVTATHFNKDHGMDVRAVIAPAAASATVEIINVPLAQSMRKKLKRVATKDGGISLRRKACVFGAPNASGCKRN